MSPEQKNAFLEALNHFGKTYVKVGGWSMWPAIPKNSQILISSTEVQPGFGRIVALFVENQLVVHRWVFPFWPTKSRFFWFQGDFGHWDPVRMHQNEIVGVAVAIERNGHVKRLRFKKICGWFWVLISFLGHLWFYLQSQLNFRSTSHKRGVI